MIVARHAVRRRRRGAILLVVLALLALFAVIGLSFVLYAESEATSSRIYREAKNNRDRVAPDADSAAGAALSQLVYGALDPQSGFNGADLARLLYGFDPVSGNDIAYNGIGLVHETLTLQASNGAAASVLPINRAEVIHYALTRLGPAAGGTPAPLVKIDAEHSRGDGSVRTGVGTTGAVALPTGGHTEAAALAAMIFIPKNAPYTYPDRKDALVAAVDPVSGRVIVPSGHRPSLFGRSPPFNPSFPAVPGNPNWYSTAGRFRTLRPRPVEQMTAAELGTASTPNTFLGDLASNGIPWPIPDTLTPAQVQAVHTLAAKYTKFPYPTPNPDNSTTGDVQNLKFALGPQRNDSYWVDARLPTQEYKGRKVAPLVAPLLVPLNGRLDLNAVASLVGGQHRSAAGFGPHEINPAWLSALAQTNLAQAQTNANQYTQTRFGSNTTTPTTPSGVNAKPFQPVLVAGASQNLPAPSYARVPWDTLPTGAPDYSSINPANTNKSAPDYSNTGYATAALDPAAGTSHPTLWNPAQRGSYTTTDPNPDGTTSVLPRGFPVTDLRLFAAKYSGKAVDYQSQTFLANDRRAAAPPAPTGFAAFQNEFLGNGNPVVAGGIPTSFGAGPASPGNLTRSLVTTLSGGFARPGLGANFGLNSTAPTPSFQLAAGGTTPALADAAGTASWPLVQISTASLPPGVGGGVTQADTPLAGTGGPPPAGYQYNAPRFAERVFTDSLPTTGDGTLASNTFKRIAQNLRAGLGGVDLNRPLADYRLRLTEPLTGEIGNQLANTDAARSNQAAEDRQAFARDIFLRLAVATGARIGYDPAVTTASSYYAPYVLPQPTATVGQYSLTVSGYAADTTSVTQADYDALRWLAQLAANIVDYLDPDDVSTVFVWNPSPGSLFTSVIDPADVTKVTINPPYARNLSSTVPIGGADADPNPPLAMRGVFGTEKPGLLINEVYAEIANDQADAGRTTPNAAAQNAFEVRFFVELLNPANRDPDPTVPGSVVHPNSLQTAVTGMPPVPNARGAVALNYKNQAITCYRVVITDNGDSAFTDLTGLRRNSGTAAPGAVANPRGDIVTNPDSVKAIADLFALQVADAAEVPNTPNEMVEPNDGAVSGAIGSPAGRSGFAVVGPQYTPVSGDVAFTPDPAAAGSLFKMALRKNKGPETPNQNYNPTPANAPDALFYTTGPLGNAAGALDQTELTAWLGQNSGASGRKHAVLLQRLANPHIPFNADTNPYLTVDYSTRVEVQDGAKNLKAANTGRTPAAPALNTRFATGRVQPFAGDEGETQSPPLQDLGAATTFAQSLTLRQTGTSGGAATSFFSHNTPTPAAPANKFQWLTHLDRKLVSPAELLFVGATAPHQLTHRFGQPQASGTPLFHRHDLQHRRPDLTTPPSVTNVEGPLYAADPTFTRVASPLYRALEVLAVKPWTVGVPYGGRQAGKVNVNMLWDENPATGRSRVFDAILDKSAGNAFTDTASTGDTAVIWSALKGSRSPGWAANPAAPDGFDATGAATAGAWVGKTADEDPTAAPGTADRPLKGFGVGTLGPAPAGNFISVPAGGGLEDTLLRPRTVATTAQPTPDNRPLFSTATPGAHPMQDHEPLRKALNSLTTVSDTYVLVLTVGFFEVREETAPSATDPGTRVLGAEVYNDAPGDLRKQFMAVIDRTALTAKPGVDQTGANRPFNASVFPTGLVNSTDTAPWVLELSGPTPAAGNTVKLFTPPLTTGTTGAADTADPGFVVVTPALTPAATPTSAIIGVADNPSGTRFLSDGTPVAVTASWDNSSGTPVNTGTRFFIGTGENRELVEAYIDSGSTWSYNANTGELKLLVRVIDPTTGVAGGTVRFAHVAGEAATNANFGNPGPQNKTYKPGQADAVVRMFAELK